MGFIFLLFHISVKTSFPGDIEFITLLEGMLVNITLTSVFLSDMHHREDERKMPNVVICCYSIYVMTCKNNPINLQYALLKSISSAFLSFQRWFWNADGIPCHFSFRFFNQSHFLTQVYKIFIHFIEQLIERLGLKSSERKHTFILVRQLNDLVTYLCCVLLTRTFLLQLCLKKNCW